MLKLLPIDSALQQTGQLGVFKIFIHSDVEVWVPCSAICLSPEPDKAVVMGWELRRLSGTVSSNAVPDVSSA